jgi:arginase
MPLRIILDSGAVEAQDTILLGARNLDPPEEEFIDAVGLRTDPGDLEEALDGTDGVYVAFDVDALEPGELESFMPEPGGLSLGEAESLLREVSAQAPVLGAGFTALTPAPSNVEPVTRLCAALGF